MHDIRWIREAPEAFDRAMARRGLEPQSGPILALDERRRATQTELQQLQNRRNEASREIGQVKRQGGDAQALMDEVGRVKDRIAALEEEERRLSDGLDNLLSQLPNAPADDVPEGLDETANVELRREIGRASCRERVCQYV